MCDCLGEVLGLLFGVRRERERDVRRYQKTCKSMFCTETMRRMNDSASAMAEAKWWRSRELGSALDSEVAGAIRARRIRNLTA